VTLTVALLAVLPLGQTATWSTEASEKVPSANPLSTSVSPEDVSLSLWLGRSCVEYELSSLMTFPTDLGEVPQTFLPVEQLCEALGILASFRTADGVIHVSPGTASRGFDLDTVLRLLRVDGHETPVGPSVLVVEGRRALVRAEELAQWLGITLTVDQSNLAVEAASSRPFPIQLRLARERAAGRLVSGRAQTPVDAPRLDASYQNWAGPYVDQTVSLTLGEGSAPNLSYSALVRGDAARLGYEMSLRSSSAGGTSADFHLERQDPDSRLMGPLRASMVAIGDVDSPAVPLLSGTTPIVGLSLSSYPLCTTPTFDERTLLGYAPPGWDVELLRNDILIDYQIVGEDGRYQFAQVPFLYGMNDLRIRLHGPHGEYRELKREALVGTDITVPGEGYYSFASGKRPDGTWQSVISGDWGIGQQLSLAGSVARIASHGAGQYYFSGGLRGYADDLCGALDVLAGPESGTGGRLQLMSKLAAGSLFAECSYLRGAAAGVSQARRDGLNIRARADGIRLGRGGNTVASLSAALAWPRGLPQSREVVVQVAGRLSGWRFGSGHRWSETSMSGLGNSEVLGELSLSRDRATNGCNAQVGYRLAPAVALVSLALGLHRELQGQRTVSIAVQQAARPAATSFSASLSQHCGSHARTASVMWSDHGGFSVGLGISASFGFIPLDGLRDSKHQLASEATAATRVFLDSNGDGVWGRGERALANVGFIVNDCSSPDVSDEDGTAVVGRLLPFEYTRLRISQSTLEEPGWRPSPQCVVVRSRPGASVPVLLAVVPVGEITGSVQLNREGVLEPAVGLPVEVLSSTGTVLRSERTAYDGYYSIPDVPVGQYTVRVQMESPGNGRVVQCQRRVVLGGEDTLADGVDLVLEAPTPALAPPADEL
jgi:hypothetical protein